MKPVPNLLLNEYQPCLLPGVIRSGCEPETSPSVSGEVKNAWSLTSLVAQAPGQVHITVPCTSPPGNFDLTQTILREEEDPATRTTAVRLTVRPKYPGPLGYGVPR